jgi:hypothetical protein
MALSMETILNLRPSTSKEIQAATGLSQSSVARQIKKMGDSVIQLQRGRSILYASTCNAFGSDDKLPLGIIDSSGKTILIAFIRPLGSGGFFVEPVRDVSIFLMGEKRDGLYEDLPYFLYDLRPQGFLGRQIAQAMTLQSDDFPPNPNYWTTNHIGRYLISNGDDLPGNLIFGEQAMLRVKRKPVAVLDKDYPALAKSVMSGEVPGSSMGGEQPKFTAFNGDSLSQMIVKFSPEGDSEVAVRWRDILITEHHAAEVINNSIFPAATSRLFEMDGRLFLETQRFDRLEEFGRSSMISLDVIDREYIGSGSNWPKVMRKLFKNGMISEQDSFNAESLWYFGRLINNTDMHLGNLSLSIDDDLFRLLPVYDMCSMGFAPKSSGEVQPLTFEAPDIQETNINDDQIETVKQAAHEFWENVANDDRISTQFKNFLQQGNPIDLLSSDP